MVSFWQRVSNIGVDDLTNPQIRKKIILSNQFAVSVSSIIFIYSTSFIFLFHAKQFVNLAGCLIYLSTLIFNRMRWYNFSRLWLNFWPPVIILLISVFLPEKMIIIFRFALFSVILIPIILFSIEEKRKMTAGILWVIGISMGLAPLSKWFKNIFGIVPFLIDQPIDWQITGTTLLSYIIFIFSFLYFQRLNLTAEKQLAEKTVLTEELLKKELVLNDHLEKERNTLKQRNDIIENDLDIAGKIQLQFIPSKAPFQNIAFYYKSAAQIGGDFFDFVRFKSDEKIGIFISDVSGHGVSAAFITSMIKSALQQSRTFIDQPSQVLSFLNDSLLNQTGGQFVTAFYGILNRRTLHFQYSNAGHNPPYVILKNKAEYLSSESKGLPLAVLSSSEMQSIKKEYRESVFQFTTESKLLLYTDGLTEAVKENEPLLSDFENSNLVPLLEKISPLPAQEFIRILTENLIQFRGSENFEDDVCMICLDL